MSDSNNSHDANNCCSCIEPRPSRYNRPGLSQINYRLDTHAGFMRRMLAGLHNEKLAEECLEDLQGISLKMADELRKLGINTIQNLAATSPEELSACVGIELSTTRKFIGQARERAIRQVYESGPLHSLNAYTKDDHAIAILDAFSCIANVLTFYQERIANEGFLRTATERRSIASLSKALGYKLMPGIAASTFLVFMVEDSTGSLKIVDVPAGTKVKNIPLPGELPQTFETMSSFKARMEWNLLRPNLIVKQKIESTTKGLMLKGLNLNLTSGDAILLLDEERMKNPGSDAWEVRIISTIVLHPECDATFLTWDKPLLKVKKPMVYAMRNYANLFGFNAPKMGIFTHEAGHVKAGQEDLKWPDLKLPVINGISFVDLDNFYPKVLPGSWIVLSDPGIGEEIYRVEHAHAVFRDEFTLRSKITRIATDIQKDLDKFSVRETTILLNSEPLIIADTKEMFLDGNEIEFDCYVPDLKNGLILIVSGKSMRARVKKEGLKMNLPDDAERALNKGALIRILSRNSAVEEKPDISWKVMDGDGYVGDVNCNKIDLEFVTSLDKDEVINEVIKIKAVLNHEGRTVVLLDESMKNSYDRTTVAVYANVVSSTHGETVKEILGSGNSTYINQQFSLKSMPLTFIPGDHVPDSTLEITVNDVIWREAQSFHYLDAADQNYVVDIGDDGRAKIVFGDGKNGARLPSGVENVSARYRYGMGKNGSVPAGSLTLLQSRPRGIRSITNPLPASGAQSQENITTARTNAPLRVLTLDRIVSIRDYEDFSRTFPGISKATVRSFQTKKGRIIHITIASSDGSELDSGSELLKSLIESISEASTCGEMIELSSFKLKTFSIDAGVLVREDHHIQNVIEDVKRSLLQEFSFKNRDLGQHISSSEILECIHRVDGVMAIDLNRMELDPVVTVNRVQRSDLEHQLVQKTNFSQLLPSTNRCTAGRAEKKVDSEVSFVLRSELANLVAKDDTEEIIPAELLLINPSANGIVLRDLRL